MERERRIVCRADHGGPARRRPPSRVAGPGSAPAVRPTSYRSTTSLLGAADRDTTSLRKRNRSRHRRSVDPHVKRSPGCRGGPAASD